MYDKMTSNGNGNKANMRIVTLENLLKAAEATGASARVNSLKQVIRRNKTDMAPDAKSSLDLMRVIFQNEITREIWQILDRHARTTFSPAIENLRRNGHVVDEEVMSHLFLNILEAAKTAFVLPPDEAGQPPPSPLPPQPAPQPQEFEVPRSRRRDHHQQQQQHQHAQPQSQYHHYQHQQQQRTPQQHHHQQPQPTQHVPHHQQQHHQMQQQQQPQPQQHHFQHPGYYHQQQEVDNPRAYYDHSDIYKWSPERFGLPTLFVSGIKVAQHMGQTLNMFFTSFPHFFRYVCDDHDRRILADDGRLREDSPQIYLVCLEDVREIAANVQELEPYAFCVKEAMIMKIRQYAQPFFERLIHRKQQQQQQQQQQMQQQWQHYEQHPIRL